MNILKTSTPNDTVSRESRGRRQGGPRCPPTIYVLLNFRFAFTSFDRFSTNQSFQFFNFQTFFFLS